MNKDRDVPILPIEEAKEALDSAAKFYIEIENILIGNRYISELITAIYENDTYKFKFSYDCQLTIENKRDNECAANFCFVSKYTGKLQVIHATFVDELAENLKTLARELFEKIIAEKENENDKD